MKDKNGNIVVTCCMTDYEEHRACGSCMYFRRTGPFAEGYCIGADRIAPAEEGEENER